LNIHERLAAFWSGEKPDKIPYTIYFWEWQHTMADPAWLPMYEKGLGVTHHLSTVRSHTRDLEIIHEDYVENGTPWTREIQRTPIGDITQTWEKGWHRKYLIENANDYRVMTYIAEHMEFSSCYDEYLKAEQEIKPYGIALSCIGRTPLQYILVDYIGLENFAYHLADYGDEIRTLYNVMRKNFRRTVEIAAKGPGRFISNLENFTAESLGPKRYGEFLLPVYEECFPILQAEGKIVGSHYDGRTASCKELIARAPIDLIESLTEPNEGDQTLDQARAAWPNKLLWCNIRVGDYQLPPDQLRAQVQDMVRRGTPDGSRLAFEVSEHIPVNWRESMPVVLDALADM